MTLLAAESAPTVETPAPAPKPPITMAEPPTEKKPKNKITAVQLDLALTKFGGDRKMAAADLGLTYEQVKQRIHVNGFLRVKWSRAGVVQMSKNQPAKPTEDHPQQLAQRQITDAYTQLSLNSNRILKQIQMLEKRIDRHEAALASGDVEKMKTDCFGKNVDGNPVEEEMVRDNLIRLFEEYRMQTKTFQDGAWVNAKISELISKRGGRGGGAGGAQRSGMPKFAPKSALILEASTS